MSRLKKKLILGILLMAIAVAATMATEPEAEQKPAPVSTDPKDAILTLSVNKTFFCTAWVISNTLAITAKHCTPAFQYGTVASKAINGTFISEVTVKAVDEDNDRAILEGNFYTVPKLVMESSYFKLSSSILTSKRIIACGFSGEEGYFKCIKLSNCAYTLFMARFGFIERGAACEGVLDHGMSGGPVIDLETGKVIGVNTAVDKLSRISIFTSIEDILSLLK